MKDLIQPLVHQPGEGWEYGVSLSWRVIAVLMKKLGRHRLGWVLC